MSYIYLSYAYCLWKQRPLTITIVICADTASWGIAWWVNDLLIPEVYVERGQTYYFTVEGGKNPANQAR